MTRAFLPMIPHDILPGEPLRLCTLWDMFTTPTYKIVNHAFGLQRTYDDMKRRFHEYLASNRESFSLAEYSDNDRAGIASMDAAMRPWLESQELKASLARLDRVVAYAADATCHIDDLAELISTLMEALEDELEEKKIFCISSKGAELYADPLHWFTETSISFPSAVRDIEEACRCFALERYTACVYHSMGILQIGLFALARDVGITLKFPIELADWGDIIRKIEEKITPYAALPRGDSQRERYDHLYAGAASHFRYLKDGWRNHVAHMREVYDRDKANTALTHVRDFMESLSTRLHE
jgi:hypothetical protein